MKEKIGNIKLGIGAIGLRHKYLSSQGHIPFIVYTPGKVGSSTVYASLKEVFPLVYHIHSLLRERVQKFEDRYIQKVGKYPYSPTLRGLYYGTFDHISASKFLLTQNLEEKPCVYITLFRDPFETILSHLFNNPKVHHQEILDTDGKIIASKAEEKLISRLEEFDPQENWAANWLNMEFKQTTGVDFFLPENWDNQLGRGLYKNEKGSTFIALRTDTINENLAYFIHREFNQNLSIINRKERSKSVDGHTYAEFKKNLHVSKSHLEKLYSTQYAQTFFTQKHIDSVIHKWSK